jgi:predicted nucleotidyltransferase component of viral defense system
MTDFTHLKEWFQLPDETKLRIFTETGREIGLPAYPVEKDWWVVHTLALIFTMDCAGSLVFKGGTSLSKGWNLIKRFSEDIDLVLDKEYLGFTGELGNKAIKRLRKKTNNYLIKIFTKELQNKFEEVGFTDVSVKHRPTEHEHVDHVIIEIYHPKLTEKDTYLKPDVLIEVGSRSLKEPYTDRTFTTMVAEKYSGEPYADKPITIPTVNPERTFLEKIFLLHEEHQRPDDKRRVEKLSRHLYDIEKLGNTKYAEIALGDSNLYHTIVEHRKKFNRVSGVDYTKHIPEKIAFIPPAGVLSEWESDYKEMKESMILNGDAMPFNELIDKLKILQSRINKIKWD